MIGPILLLIAAGALVGPALVIGNRLELAKIWKRGLLWVTCGHFISAAAILTLVPPAELGVGISLHPIFSGTTLIACSPLTLWISPTYIGGLGGMCYLLYAVNSLLWSIPVTALCYLIRRRQTRTSTAQRQRVEEAIAKILEDGVVTIPKGPHAPHRRWSSRTGGKADIYGTSAPRQAPYHGMPWK